MRTFPLLAAFIHTGACKPFCEKSLTLLGCVYGVPTLKGYLNMEKDILNRVLKILNKNMDNIKIDVAQIDKDLSVIGMDSLVFIRVIVALEEEFDIEFPDDKLLMSEMNTVSKILDVVADTLAEKHEDRDIGG